MDINTVLKLSVARLNNSNKRSNPRRKNNGSTRYNQRNVPATREKQKNSSFDCELDDTPSTDDNAVSSSSSVQEVATAVSDLTIANDDPVVCINLSKDLYFHSKNFPAGTYICLSCK